MYGGGIFISLQPLINESVETDDDGGGPGIDSGGRKGATVLGHI